MKIKEFFKKEKTKHRLQGIGIGLAISFIFLAIAVGAYSCSNKPDETKAEYTAFVGQKQPKKAIDFSSVDIWIFGGFNRYSKIGRTTSNYPQVYFTCGADNGTGVDLSGTELGNNSLFANVNNNGGFASTTSSDGTYKTASQFMQENGWGIRAAYASYVNAGFYKFTCSWTSSQLQKTHFTFICRGRSSSNQSSTYYNAPVNMAFSDFPENLDYRVYIMPLSSTGSNVSNSTGNIFVSLDDIFVRPAPSVSSSEAESVGPVDGLSVNEDTLITFEKTNPFSAFAVNPANNKFATTFDTSANFILYNGTSNGATSTIMSTAIYDYDVGEFYLQGNSEVVFDTIRLTCQNYTTDNVFTPDGTSLVHVTQNMWDMGVFTISSVHYYNSTTETGVKVMDRTFVRIDEYNALSGYGWINEGYRSIRLTAPDTALTINGYEATSLWWLRNNAVQGQGASVAVLVLGGGDTGVFGVLGNAFTSVASIFGIAIIPGLTIGTLMFVPLVVAVIIAVVKLLGK